MAQNPIRSALDVSKNASKSALDATMDAAQQTQDQIKDAAQLAQDQIEGLLRDLAASAEAQSNQIHSVLAEIRDRSKENSDKLGDLVDKRIRAQLGTLGIATKSDIARLERKIAKLEKPAKKSAARAAGAKKRAADKSAAKKPATTKAAAKKSS